MATATQLMPSPTQGMKSAFSPFTDSPSSPAPFSAALPSPNRSSNNPVDSLHPPPSPYPAYVDPSPVDSNGTASTEIEDDAQEDPPSENDAGEVKSPDTDEMTSPASQASLDMLSKIDTSLPSRPRSNSDEAPQSVIHAPAGFKQFDEKKSPPRQSTTSPLESDRSETTVVSPTTPESIYLVPQDNKRAPAIDTHLAVKDGERTTPRAQTRQEAEEGYPHRWSRASSSLEDIAETDDGEKIETDNDESVLDSETEGLDELETERTKSRTISAALEGLNNAEHEISTLKTALSECWTLCNTLAGLSHNHRERMFSFTGKGEIQEQAWRTCWRLCQNLYESRNEDHASQVRPTLELCRDFCQALFEVRQRGDEASDSVLRVSFELNNHLYNTHDRNLPEAFTERTLDFYLTLCHRLMKQRTILPDETDSLLRACWSLAEMLFNLRQNNRDGKPVDEELLGSAVQACWDLCDLFREGWTQVRPDRGTPRPTQHSFPASVSHQSARSERSSSVGGSFHSAKSAPPETPTTIYDDQEEMSPDELNVPNILVLGPEQGNTRTHNRWSSSASTLSTYSDTSQRSSSTATAGREDPHLTRLKVLILKAAMNSGYTRNMTQTLPAFVKALPSNSFGTMAWQMSLLDNYKRLVLADPTLRTPGSILSGRMSAGEVARAVQWMSRSEQFFWMRDLYRLVFGFFPEDAASRKNVAIQV